MNPDLICCWPRHVDFPLWRQFIRDNRERFAKVIIVFTDMNVAELDYRSFIQDAMLSNNITFLDCLPAAADEDWRNKAVNMALTVSDAQWIWFTEQDFLIHNSEPFWTLISESAKAGADVIVYEQGDNRLHPCCLFIKRFILDNFTDKDFGVIPDVADHFSKISENLRAAPNQVTILQIGEVTRGTNFEHLNGLSQNMWMLQQNLEPNYQPERFKEYCMKCLEAQVYMHDDFVQLFRKYLKIRDVE